MRSTYHLNVYLTRYIENNLFSIVELLPEMCDGRLGGKGEMSDVQLPLL